MHKSFLASYFLSLITLLTIDGIWLSLIAKNWYMVQFQGLMKDKIELWPAALFYGIYAIGLSVLVILPEVEKGTLSSAITKGALMGLCAYAAYDLTNLATLKNWSLTLTLGDMAWGTFLSAVVSGVVFLVMTKFL